MADISQILNVLLYDLLMTPEQNDYSGRVQLNGTLYNENVARDIVAQRSEFRYETILSILQMADDIKRNRIASGYAVVDGVSQMHPSISGRFWGKGAQFDPAEHAKTVVMTPTAQMRRAMEAAKVVILGVAPTGPMINSVQDVYTSAENSVITPGRNLKIFGQRLRVAGDDLAVVGLWFVSAADNAVRTRVDDRDLVDNNPSQLTVIVPALEAGGYFVEVVTQSTSNSQILIKEPRSYRFEIVLTVE